MKGSLIRKIVSGDWKTGWNRQRFPIDTCFFFSFFNLNELRILTRKKIKRIQKTINYYHSKYSQNTKNNDEEKTSVYVIVNKGHCKYSTNEKRQEKEEENRKKMLEKKQFVRFVFD